MQKFLGIMMLFLGASAVAMATAAPEIDPTSGVSALALIAGGLLAIRGRRKR